MYSKAWHQFIESVEQAKKALEFEKNEEYFFRGHCQSHYQLLPTIFRSLGKGIKKEDLWENESDSFYEFKARAKEVIILCEQKL